MMTTRSTQSITSGSIDPQTHLSIHRGRGPVQLYSLYASKYLQSKITEERDYRVSLRGVADKKQHCDSSLCNHHATASACLERDKVI